MTSDGNIIFIFFFSFFCQIKYQNILQELKKKIQIPRKVTMVTMVNEKQFENALDAVVRNIILKKNKNNIFAKI